MADVDKMLAEAIIAEVDLSGLPSRDRVEGFLRVGEWAQAAIEVLADAAEGRGRVSPELVGRAVVLWPDDMGGMLAAEFAAMAGR
ncbi:MAG: hypothetical protein LBG60_09105 [Bifidobacteriaceae bacterium]|nr:hypothetical protein [Bifidobacteriaceae bacterium]